MLLLVVDVALIVVIEAEELRRKPPVPAEHGEAEHSRGQPELGTQGAENDRLPEAVRNPQPHHGKV